MMLKLFLSVCTVAIALNASMAANVDFAKSANNFATNLYLETIKEKSGNVIISPVSIQTAVSLAMYGASGQTKEQMKAGLQYQAASDDEIRNNYKKFSDNIDNTAGVKIANKIYVMTGHTVKQSFQDVATKSFHSEAQNLDFAHKQESANTINQWVEGQTNNKIKDLIAADSLGADTRMVLVNAIYFKDFWKYQFKKENTYKAPFYLDETNSVDVDFMKIKEHFKYGNLRNYDATAIELPYNNSDITLMIILPNKRTGLAELESKLNEIDFNEISQEMYSQEVNVEIPKFKIEFDIKLNNVLSKMGMEKMFSNGAEFDNLLESNEPLQVSEVIHKAFIEVNEEGAEAAAATGVRIMKRSLPMYHDFFAYHPFLFALRKSNYVFFSGRLVTLGEDLSQHDEL